MVALVIALNILLCKLMEALIKTDTNVADLISVATIIEKVKVAKTITQVCRVIFNPKIVSDESSLKFDVDVVLSLNNVAPLFKL